MRLDIHAPDLPEAISDLSLEVRFVDVSEADAPARRLAAPYKAPVTFPRGADRISVSLPAPELSRGGNAPASLLVRMTGKTADGRNLLYLNTSDILVPKRPDQPIAVALSPAG